MKTFEEVYDKLNSLFIENLADYIYRINENHNDGIIIKKFKNQNLKDKPIQTPNYFFNFENSANTEKDRVLNNTVFVISLEIKTEIKSDLIAFWRYFEAIQEMLTEQKELNATITEVNGNKIYIKITCQE